MSSIAAGTTTGSALVSTGDTTGELVLKTNGTTTAVTIDTSQNVTIEGDLTVNGTLIGGGDVSGPASSTDNAFARFDSTTGKILQNSSATLDDNGAPTFVGSINVSGTSAASGGINLFEDTDNGTNKALLTAPAALGSDITVTLPDITSTLGFRNIPPVGTKTGSYTLATSDVGEYVQVGSGGSITIPDATFAEGDAISIFNNTSGNITITCTITTAYIAGTDSDKASVTLATRGVATILFISSTVCVIFGNVT